MTGTSTSKPLSGLAVSVLALLTEGPLHPYEMHQTLIERHEDQLVKIKPGTLYHTVDRLAASELIEISGTDRAGNRPERTTYAITEAGRGRLQADVVALLGTPVNEYPRFPQAIAEAHNLPRAIVLDQLRSRIETFRRRLDEFAEGRSKLVAKDLPSRYWLDLDYLENMYTAEMKWLSALVEKMQSRELDWPDTYESLQPPKPDIHSDSYTRTTNR